MRAARGLAGLDEQQRHAAPGVQENCIDMMPSVFVTGDPFGLVDAIFDAIARAPS
jgi:hypothetical protein